MSRNETFRSRQTVISKEAPRRTIPWPGALRAD